MKHLIIFVDEKYTFQGRNVYTSLGGNSNWLLYAEAISRHFDRATVFLSAAILLPTAPEPDLPHIMDLDSKRLEIVPLPPYSSLMESVPLLPSIFRLCRQQLTKLQEAEALLIRIPSLAGLILAELARRRGKKICFSVAGNIETQNRYVKSPSPVKKIWLALAKAIQLVSIIAARRCLVLAVGQELAEKYAQGVPFFPKPALVRNCPDSMLAEGALFWRSDTCQGNPVRLVRVCQLIPTKGVEYLLEGIRLLQREGLPVELLLAGTGEAEYVQKLKDLAAALGVMQSVQFLGAVPHAEIPDLFRRADIQVISSLGEGVPRVIFEGWAASVPLVATTVGGIPGIVQHEENGLLVPPGDPFALANAIERVIREKDLRQKLIRNGFAFAKEHTQEKQAKKIADAIKEFSLSPQ